MKALLIAALVLSSAAPVVVVPTFADAQVLTGRGTARAAERRARPALSEREQERLYATQDQVSTLEGQIATLTEASETAGGLTPEQTTQMSAYQTQLAEARTVVDRLEAKRARRSS